MQNCQERQQKQKMTFNIQSRLSNAFFIFITKIDGVLLTRDRIGREKKKKKVLNVFFALKTI